MSDFKNCLVMYLDAPMQSWGYSSRFDRRTTLSYPTKSGIIGLLCAAMGVPKADRETVRQLAGLNMQVFTLTAVRRLTDFHTVGGGYDLKAEREFMPRKVNEATPSTVVTYRDYLTDGKFGVLLSGDDVLLKQCEDALSNPKWGVWFGRKSCIPASLVCQGRFETEEKAREHLESISEEGRIIRRVTEVSRFEEGTDTLSDVPLDFSARTFTIRRIEDTPV